MNFWWTADTHFGHGKVIEYSNRPFKSSSEMNERLIFNWNERVKQDDMIFFLGDFVFKSGEKCEKAQYWIDRLNGQKIFIRGNHDNNNSLKTIIDCVHITFANKRINMVHKPEHSNPDFEINLVGHVHDKWKIRTFKQHYEIIEKTNQVLESDRNDWEGFLERNKSKRNSESVIINVGVDQWDFRPVSFNEIQKVFWQFKKGLIK